MSKYLSDQNQLAFIYESGTYATTSGTRQWIGLCQDCSMEENVNSIPIRYQGSTDRNVDMFEDGNVDYNGKFTYFPQDWKFLGMAIGSVGETTLAGSHCFTETNSDDANYAIKGQSLSSFTLEDSKNNGTAGSNFIRTLNGCIVDSFAATFTQGDPVSCEVNAIGQNLVFTSGAVTKVTPAVTRPFMFSKSTLEIPSGTTVDNSIDFTFTVNNNLEGGHYNNGSKVIAEALPINRDYELATTLKMDSKNAKTYYEQYYLGGSTFNAMIKTLGAGGSAFVIMSGCKLTDMETPSPVEGTQDQSLTIVPQHVSVTVEDAIVDYNAW